MSRPPVQNTLGIQYSTTLHLDHGIRLLKWNSRPWILLINFHRTHKTYLSFWQWKRKMAWMTSYRCFLFSVLLLSAPVQCIVFLWIPRCVRLIIIIAIMIIIFYLVYVIFFSVYSGVDTIENKLDWTYR